MDGTEGVIKTMVTFIVERDGTITNIKQMALQRF
jgi:protein TonB